MTDSASETKATINKVFESFIAAVSEAVDVRRKKLLDEVQQVRLLKMYQ